MISTIQSALSILKYKIVLTVPSVHVCSECSPQQPETHLTQFYFHESQRTERKSSC